MVCIIQVLYFTIAFFHFAFLKDIGPESLAISLPKMHSLKLFWQDLTGCLYLIYRFHSLDQICKIQAIYKQHVFSLKIRMVLYQTYKLHFNWVLSAFLAFCMQFFFFAKRAQKALLRQMCVYV